MALALSQDRFRLKSSIHPGACPDASDSETSRHCRTLIRHRPDVPCHRLTGAIPTGCLVNRNDFSPNPGLPTDMNYLLATATCAENPLGADHSVPYLRDLLGHDATHHANPTFDSTTGRHKHRAHSFRCAGPTGLPYRPVTRNRLLRFQNYRAPGSWVLL